MATIAKTTVTKTAKRAVKKPARVTAPKSASTLDSGFAVIETGGKQYKVSSGDTLLVEKLSDMHKKGDTISFDKVLLLSLGEKVTIGDPYIKNAAVKAIFEEHTRGKKINVLKFKSKSRWTRRYGHRQTYAKIKVL